MGLKAIFNTMKKEGYVVKKLDQYLLSLNKEVNDRAININSPSQAGACMRANYFSRLQFPQDGNAIDSRTRRIFDNGHHVHARLQDYMMKANILVNDEIPLRNDKYNIQGHTDGFINLIEPRINIKEEIDYVEIVKILDLNKDKISKDYFKVETFKRKISTEIGILEIKSINSGGFSSLKDAREDHKLQGTVYMFCAEERRKELIETYKSEKEFKSSLSDRIKYYANLYRHLQDGNKYTREEKLLFKVVEHIKADTVLFNCPRPINKIVFLYESKDTQDLEEFTVEYDLETLYYILDRYERLNSNVNRALEKAKEKGYDVEDLDIDPEFRLSDELRDLFMKYTPEREGTARSTPPCRWCNYKVECFN